MSPGDHVYRAMYDYTPSSDSEMPLSEGQVSRVKNIQWRLRESWLLLLLHCSSL